MRGPVAPERATALVVGVGGLGCPAAWALADAGVATLILVDPDVVEASNLPRQVLFGEKDVGRPKAVVAAERLARPGLSIVPVVGRFDADSGPPLLARADVAVDATDGAATKDLVNALAVRAGVPYVHAAALAHEGRVLDVPAGGRPCLACLFGSGAADDRDTCAALGVMPGVVGAAGFLAARAALDLLASPWGPSKGLRVLDLLAGRGVTLEAVAEGSCPACGAGARSVLPTPREAPRPVDALGPAVLPAGALDLRHESCPMNLLRARRAVDRMPDGGEIEVWLGEEGAATVPDGIAAQGHAILLRERVGDALRIRIRRRGGMVVSAQGSVPAPIRADERWLSRFARQVVLPEVGEEGQRRFGEATVLVAGKGDAASACAVYLAAAGVGTVVVGDPGEVGDARAGRWPFRAAAAATPRRRALAETIRSEIGSAATFVVDGAPSGALAAASVGAFAGLPPAVPTPGRRVWCATAPGGGGMVVRHGVLPPTDWVDAPAALLAGPVALAAGALLADAVLRRLLVARPPTTDVVLKPDGTVSERRAPAAVGSES